MRNPCIRHEGCWWFVPCLPHSSIPLDPLLRRHSWNVAALSRELGFSPRGFSRMVERSVGLQAKAWLRRHRVVVACHLLREGWKIEALSKNLGFKHCSAFSREFKVLVGVSPLLYARMERARFFRPPPPDEEEDE